MTGSSFFGPPERWASHSLSLEETDDPTVNLSRPISLQSIKSALRRHRNLCLTAAAAGLLVGASLHLVVPSKYSALTKLYLVEPSLQAMSDDVALLETQAVAEQATATLRSETKETVEISPSSYKGTAISPSILEIHLTARSPAQAIAQSNALAPAFLRERTQVLDAQTNVVIARIQAQITALNSRIHQLGSQINAFPAVPTASQAADQRKLVDEQNSDNARLTPLQNQVEQDLNNETALSQGSRIIDPPSYQPSSTLKVVVTDGLSGLVAGLGLALAIAVMDALLSDRVRRRDQLAALLGTQVELSVNHLPRPRCFVGPRLRRAIRHPSPAMRQIERRLRDHLESSLTPALHIAEIGAAEPAAMVLITLAQSLAAEGKHVILLDAASSRPLTTILRINNADAKQDTTSRNGGRIALRVAPADPAEMAFMDRPDDFDAILSLTTVDPLVGVEHLSRSVTDVVVMVRAGAVSALHIEAVAHLLRHGLIGVRSAILLDSDPSDASAGLPPMEPSADTSQNYSTGITKVVRR